MKTKYTQITIYKTNTINTLQFDKIYLSNNTINIYLNKKIIEIQIYHIIMLIKMKLNLLNVLNNIFIKNNNKYNKKRIKT